jgi:ribosomal protein L40E
MSEAKFVRCNECRALNEPRAMFCSRCGSSLYGPVHGGLTPKRRRTSAAGIVMAIALLLALAVVTATLITILQRGLDHSENIDPYAGQIGTPASIGTTSTNVSSGEDANTPSTLAPVQVRPTAATASSILEATSTGSYRATNLLDGDLTTCWSEGVDGPGLGEWVRFEFSKPLVIARIELANGNQKDEERFFGDPRIRTLKVEYSNGVAQLIELADSKEYQSIVATSEAVDWVKLTIVSVYDGEQWDDTALSEVRIFQKAE